MTTKKRVVFTFDEQSLESFEKLKEHARYDSLADAVRNSLQVSARTCTVTRAELGQAIRAIDCARDYPELVATLKQHQEILSSDSAIAMMNDLLADDSLTENQRNQGKLVRAVCQDCKDRGATYAARLLSLRIIAAGTLVAKAHQHRASSHLGADQMIRRS